ncbi:hypothetical protein A0O36_02856 [Piscirickettsiaceae bacterium NZ-RLO1]|nr:hypothetical protein A0O36_02856 [Piscirickettsiaceae bacterium NZ-RLO1]
MQGIIANGDDIAFVTAGGIEKKAIKKFFQCEYNVNLGHNFEYYNRTSDKLPVLKLIAKDCALYSDAIFIDNSHRHTLPAGAAGFTVFYADNNSFNATNGTQYIELLELMVTIRAKQRKQPVVNDEDSRNVSVATSVGILHIQ